MMVSRRVVVSRGVMAPRRAMVSSRPLHAALVLGALVLLAPRPACALDAVFMSEDGPLAEAVRYELALRGASVEIVEPPLGADLASRIREAEHALRAYEARFALWVDMESDAAALRLVGRATPPTEAPIPTPPEASPRTVALIATGLIAEATLAHPSSTSEMPMRIELGRAGGEASEVEVASDAEVPLLSPYFAIRAYVVGFTSEGDYTPTIPELDLGVAFDRTWRIGVSAYGPITTRDRTGFTAANAGYGGGVSFSARVFADRFEMRVGATTGFAIRAAANPLHNDFPLSEPESFVRPGFVGMGRLLLGGRTGQGFALMGALMAMGAFFEDDPALFSASLGLVTEWY